MTEPKTITLSQYKDILKAAEEEESTWRKEEYLGEELSITPTGECLWWNSNWWFNSEDEAKKQLRQECFQNWIGCLSSYRSLVKGMQEKQEEKSPFGHSLQYVQDRIQKIISGLQSIMGLTMSQIEEAISFLEKQLALYKERKISYEEAQPVLPEENHQYFIQHYVKSI